MANDLGSAAAILVSNNSYRLGHAAGSGTRPRIDGGVLGIAVVESTEQAGRPWREWASQTFPVPSEVPVSAGVDGEAVELEPPIRFASRPGVLRVRIARQHPGASPSAALPNGGWDSIRSLLRIAFGRSPPRPGRRRAPGARGLPRPRGTPSG